MAKRKKEKSLLARLAVVGLGAVSRWRFSSVVCHTTRQTAATTPPTQTLCTTGSAVLAPMPPAGLSAGLVWHCRCFWPHLWSGAGRLCVTKHLSAPTAGFSDSCSVRSAWPFSLTFVSALSTVSRAAAVWACFLPVSFCPPLPVYTTSPAAVSFWPS